MITIIILMIKCTSQMLHTCLLLSLLTLQLWLMGEGFMGGVHPPFTIFFDFRLRSLRYEKDFLPVLSKLSQASMVKIFHFSDEWKVVSVAPQRGGVHPP